MVAVSSISVSDSTKSNFDELKPDDMTHDEFVAELIQVYRAYEGEPVDVEKLADELSHTLVSKIELGAFRGSKQALEIHGGNE